MLSSRGTVIIEKGSTAIYVTCNADGRLSENASLSIHPFLNSNLVEYEWDFRRKKNFPVYRYYKYDRNSGLLHMPVNILPYFEQYLKSNLVEYQIVSIPPNESVSIEIIATGNFKERDYQVGAIEFLSKPGMRALELQTGLGKSFIAVRSIMEIGRRALIIVPAFLLNQWAEALVAICDTEISIIQGNKTIRELIDADYVTTTPVFLATVNTLQAYASGLEVYDSFPPFREFIRRMMFGAKIVDECHLNFNANMQIDIQSDIEHNIYLSATYIRSSSNSHRIFRKIFPEEIKYEKMDYKKYVNVTECRYNLGEIADRATITERGYSQYRYEKFLLRNSKRLSDFLCRVLHPVIEKYYLQVKRDGQKLLILVGLKEFAELLAAWCQDNFPGLISSEYLQDTVDGVLETSDIIISTLGSMGTGKDQKGLRTVILFVSFKKEARTFQSIGRLRQLEHDTPEFVYLVNTKVASHRNHAKARRPIYQHIAKQFTIVET